MSDTKKLQPKCTCGHEKSIHLERRNMNHEPIFPCFGSNVFGIACTCETYQPVDSQPEPDPGHPYDMTDLDSSPVSKEPSRETNPRVHRHDTYNPDVCAADCPACAWQEGFDARKAEISRLKSLPEKIFAELDKRKDRTTMNVSGYQIEWGIVKSVFAEQAKLQKQSEQEGK